MIIQIIASVFIVVILIVCIKLSNKVIKPRISSLENELNKDSKIKEIYDNLPKIDMQIKVNHKNHKHDVLLDATLILRENLQQSDLTSVKNQEKVVILCHGFTSNRIGCVKYIDIFRQKGYNILIYDHRNSGSSSGDYTTMGYMEKHDLKAVLDECRNLFGQDAKIGLFGESMGASTALMSLELDENIEFIIADCGYSVLEEELAYQLKKQYNLSKYPFIQISSLITKIKGGFYYSEVKPIHTISEHGLNVPILFIHGEHDKFTPTYMSEQMYEKRKSVVDDSVKTQVYIAPNSAHALSYYKNKEEYTNKVHKFLEEI